MRIKRIIIDFMRLLPLFLALSTVFIINRELANGVVTAKYFWFYASMAVAGVATLITVVICKPQFRFTVTDFLVLLFVGCVLLSSLVINDAGQNTTKLTLFMLLAVLYFCARLLVCSDDAKIETIVCFFIVVGGLVQAVWGLRQLYGFVPSQHALFKLTGSFFNPGPYAGYLAVVFPLALHFALRTVCIENVRGLFVKVISVITCIAIILTLPAAMSRASWLAVGASVLVVLAGHYYHKFSHIKNYLRAHRKKSVIAAIVVTILFFGAFAGMYHIKRDSADGRALMWKMAIHAAAQNPFGVGLGNFSAAYGEAQAAYFAAGKGSETEEHVAGSPDYGFNEYLQIAVETGIVSLIIFLAIVVLSLKSLIKNQKWGIVGSILSLLVFAFFSYPFSVLPFLIVFVILLALNEKNEELRMKNEELRIKR